MKLKFEKKLELEMEITKHRVDNDDNHRFTLAFNRNIRNCKEKEPITEVEFIIALVTDKIWFQNEYPRISNSDDVYGIDPFDDDDGDYILFGALFKDYDNFATIVQDMCIEYCKQNKIPPRFMDTANSEYSDEYCALAYLILDELTKNSIKYLSQTNEFIHNGICKYGNKEVKYQVSLNNITIESDIITINHNRLDSETLSEMISNVSLQFSKEWNQNIIGKYEWDL